MATIDDRTARDERTAEAGNSGTNLHVESATNGDSFGVAIAEEPQTFGAT